jgi:acyl phosphate:glycerol-3-phosphate acyltransferase
MLVRFDPSGQAPVRRANTLGTCVTGIDALWLCASYLAGSLPIGLLIGRLRGVDLRRAGSGNIGATNAGRVLGKPWFFVVFALDFSKSFVPTLLARCYGGGSLKPDLLGLLCGIAAVVGHVFPVFLRFKGGKGVATAAGVFFALAWAPALCALLAWNLVFRTTRFVSLASLAAAVVLPLASFALPRFTSLAVDASVQWAALLVGLLIVARHKSNIGRLLRGEEPRTGAPHSS